MNPSRILRRTAVCGLALLLMSGAALASPTLSSGSHGHEVLLLQQKLKGIGYTIRTVDGVFGSETERAVAEFQRDQKIRVTGIVNNATWRALKGAKARKGNAGVTPSKGTASAGELLLEKRGTLLPMGKPILAKGKVSAVIKTAKSYIGTPYQFGGATPKAFDCSGYLQYVFAKNGLSIPRTADEQYKLGARTKSVSQLVPGDLVFFETYEPGPSHCGIYLGSGDFIHASSSKGVRIDRLDNSYWQPRFLGGKHIVM